MRKSVSVSWSFLTPRQRKATVIITIFRVLANSLDLVGIGAIGLLVMALASGRIDFAVGTLFRIEIEETPFEVIVGLVALAAGSFLFKALIGLVLSLLSIRILVTAEVRSSRRIMNYLISSPLSEVRKYSRGDIQYSASMSSNAMYFGLIQSVSNLVTELSLMLMIVTGFFLVNPVAATVVTIYILFLLVIVQWILGNRLKKIGQDIADGTVKSTGVLFDAIQAFREISVFGKQDYFLEKFSEGKWQVGKTKGTETILRTIPRIVIEQGLMLGVLAFVGWQLLQNDTATGLASVGVFVAGAVRIIGAIIPVQQSWASLKTNQVKAQKAQDILIKDRDRRRLNQQEVDSPARLAQFQAAASLTDARRGMAVEVTNVTYQYPDADDPVVSGISLTAKPGGFVALVGPSGAGKTTLADLILGLHKPDEGTVTLDGVDPRILREAHPGLISYVPQQPGMVQGTIAENVALGVTSEERDDERVRECLKLADMWSLVSELPGDIHASMGEQANSLSGGQLQRLGMARALYSKPRLLVLDEATSALDAGSEAEVSANIQALGDAVTVIVIAHRLSTIQHADRVYVVDGGKIIGEGTFRQVRRSVPMIDEYVKLMSFDE